jgi:sugar lactone lactonase YvrE
MRDAVAVYISEDLEGRIGPLLEDRYFRFEYMRMWWPSWNYYNLNATRAANALDFSPSNTQAAQIRHGIWDIWWARDYTRYGEATGEDYSPENWNPGEHLLFYVRKDIASQVWNLGLGDGTALNPLDTVAANMCTDNWQQRYADIAYSTTSESATLSHPVDVAVSDDGQVIVAEEFANRLVWFNPSGEFTQTTTGGDDGTLNRPHGVAIGSNGDLYVTEFEFGFEHVSRFSFEDGAVVGGWGQPGQYGSAAASVPTDAFWGPRDAAVDAEGNVYISDTGNKRVRVYTSEGEYLRDIGSAGSELGQLDEPGGLAISPDGRLFVADTWNRRISVFTLDGTALYTFEVRGWYEDQGNRPYLAVDGARNLLYVGDPQAGRVLVYDTQGNCVGSFGQPSTTASDTSQFQIVAGIAVDSAGNVYVADSGAGRVLRFAPFIEGVSGAPAPDIPQAEMTEDIFGVPVEITDETGLPAESTGEPEITLEAVG